MLPDTPEFWIIASLATLWMGISKGGFGSGADFVAVAVLAVAIGPVAALALTLPLLMLMDVVTVRGFWGRWDRRSALALTAGAVPGTALGVALISVASDDALRLLIAAVALAFVGWQVGRAAGWIRVGTAPFRWWAGLTAGAGAGFTSFVSHAGGPITAVFLLSQGLGKTTFQATTAVTFGLVNVLKAACYGALGFFTAESLTANLWLAPIAVFGAWLGIRAHHMVPERVFFALTYVLLAGTGAKLIWDVLG